MSLASKTVAFFGATGGTCQAVLALSLLCGINARVLARNPSKLRELLLSQPGITEEIVESQVEIVQGDARSQDAVSKVLTTPNGVVNDIVSGLGSPLRLKLGLPPVKLVDRTLCADSLSLIIEVLESTLAANKGSEKPSYSYISSIGVYNDKKDVPFGYGFLYAVVLKEAHADKYAAEKLILTDRAKAVFRSVDILKPTALTGAGILGTGKGLSKVRVGTPQSPSLGYSISRTDVGEYVLENVVKKHLSGEEPTQYCTIVDLTT